jgi:hypothetical protein
VNPCSSRFLAFLFEAFEPFPLSLQLVVLEVERLMSQGMFRAAIALQQLGLIAAPATLFNSGTHCCAACLRGLQRRFGGQARCKSACC